MRWLNTIRVRRVLASGGATYESARRIQAIKGYDFVLHLRARRAVRDITRSTFVSHAVKNRSWSRKEHFKRKAGGCWIQS